MRTYLSSGGAAQYLGLSNGTVKAYIARGYFPEPDAIIAATDEDARPVRGWSATTLDTWQATRQGHPGRPTKHSSDR